jgi:hypothetical protein
MNVGRMHPLRLTVGTLYFEAKCALHCMSMGDKSNVIDEAETLEELRGIY